MKETAKRAAVATLVVIALVVAALALWKLKVVLALVFLGIIIAAAMRPGIDWLRRHRVPRGIGLLVHYVAVFGLIALLLWLAVPRALSQVESALGTHGLPTKASDLKHAASHSHGIKHTILVAIQKRLEHLPRASKLFHSGVSFGLKAFEILIAIFFTFATAAYWIFERDRTVDFTESWHIALYAGLCVLGVRLAEDYLIVPRVLGDAVGLSPLLVLVSVTSVGILFGGFAVVLAVPLAAIVVTLLDVIVRNRDPADEDVPTVLFPAKEAEN